MALINVGSINQFGVAPKNEVIISNPVLKNVQTFADLAEISRNTPRDSFDLITSADRRGLALKSIRLTEGFDGFISKLFHKTNEIYFIAWAHDLSGQRVNLYPGPGINPQDVMIPMQVGKLREFIGEGINLFPKRHVTGGILIRIQLWESDQEIRNFGKAMADTADAISKSELTSLLSLISVATGVTGATIALIKDASLELAKIIGTVLKANSNDYVDFFEGYYTADKVWQAGDDSYSGNSSILTLNKY